MTYLCSLGPGSLRHKPPISSPDFHVRRQLIPWPSLTPANWTDREEAEGLALNTRLRVSLPASFSLTCSLVQDTVVRGVVKVDKISPGGMAIALAGCCEVGTILGGSHLHSPVIPPSQVVTSAAEV